MPSQIPLDPKLPPRFNRTPNEARSKDELDAWWDHPYGVTLPNRKIEVWCLNGGTHDGPTRLGVADNYIDACALAKDQQGFLVALRECPKVHREGLQWMVARLQQRPDGDVEVLALAGSSLEAQIILREQFGSGEMGRG